MTDPLTSIATGLEAADRILKRAEDGVRFFARFVQRQRKKRARKKASAAAAAFSAAAKRGGMTTEDVRKMMAKSGWLIGGRK